VDCGRVASILPAKRTKGSGGDLSASMGREAAHVEVLANREGGNAPTTIILT